MVLPEALMASGLILFLWANKVGAGVHLGLRVSLSGRLYQNVSLACPWDSPEEGCDLTSLLGWFGLYWMVGSDKDWQCLQDLQGVGGWGIWLEQVLMIPVNLLLTLSPIFPGHIGHSYQSACFGGIIERHGSVYSTPIWVWLYPLGGVSGCSAWWGKVSTQSRGSDDTAGTPEEPEGHRWKSQ